MNLNVRCRHFRFLAIEEWVKRWCRSNHELATRVGLTNMSFGRDGEQKGRGCPALPRFAPKL